MEGRDGERLYQAKRYMERKKSYLSGDGGGAGGEGVQPPHILWGGGARGEVGPPPQGICRGKTLSRERISGVKDLDGEIFKEGRIL